MCKKTGTSLEVEEGLKTTRQRLLLFAANFPTLRGEEVYLSTSGWSEVRTILHRNVVPTYGLTYWHSYFLLLNVMKNQIGLENE